MKHCPVCNQALSRLILEYGLPAYTCAGCDGIWISANEYLAWLSAQQAQAEPPSWLNEETPIPVVDNRQVLPCPECGRFLRRFKVWPQIEFHLDRCSGCRGIWFDRPEWETLQAHKLDQQVSLFFSDGWQQKLSNEAMTQRFAQMYLAKFGPADYEKIKEIREWLAAHPLGSSLLAYLTDTNPYRG
jgi:Zn-finger nucleic acid-binding protein